MSETATIRLRRRPRFIVDEKGNKAAGGWPGLLVARVSLESLRV